MKLLVYGVRCKECALLCRLHYPKAAERLDVEQFLSADPRPFAFLCRMCAAVSRHSQLELCELEVRNPQLLELTAGSWIYRIQFHCGEAACQEPLDLYTEVISQEHLGGVLDWVFSLNLSMDCARGHRSTPLDVSSFRSPALVAEVCVSYQFVSA
jgi:hypothetical protein